MQTFSTKAPYASLLVHDNEIIKNFADKVQNNKNKENKYGEPTEKYFIKPGEKYLATTTTSNNSVSHNINVGGEVQSYDFNEPSSSITVANNELQVIKKGNFLTLYIIALRTK